MKITRLFMWILAVCILATVNLSAQNGEAEAACSVEMLKGSYAYLHHGTDVNDDEPDRDLRPVNTVGIWYADGKGKLLDAKDVQKKTRQQQVRHWNNGTGEFDVYKMGETTPTAMIIPIMDHACVFRGMPITIPE
jgi:hypothetical protein